jgi:hypothetical protein
MAIWAAGVGPKQVKMTWPLGQFVNLYWNGNVPSGVILGGTSPSGNNIGYPPYPTQSTYNTPPGSTPGTVSPGLNPISGVNAYGFGAGIDVGMVCSFDSQTSINDATYTGVSLRALSGWTGPTTVTLQGSLNRYSVNSSWVPVIQTIVTTAEITYFMAQPQASGFVYNSYRLVASGGSGIVDWSITGCFLDISAMGIGSNALIMNSSLGSLTISSPKIYSIVSGVLISNPGPSIIPNLPSNSTWIGP